MTMTGASVQTSGAFLISATICILLFFSFFFPVEQDSSNLQVCGGQTAVRVLQLALVPDNAVERLMGCAAPDAICCVCLRPTASCGKQWTDRRERLWLWRRSLMPSGIGQMHRYGLTLKLHKQTMPQFSLHLWKARFDLVTSISASLYCIFIPFTALVSPSAADFQRNHVPAGNDENKGWETKPTMHLSLSE